MVATWEKIQVIYDAWEEDFSNIDADSSFDDIRGQHMAMPLVEEYLALFQQQEISEPETFAKAAALSALSDQGDLANTFLLQGLAFGLDQWLATNASLPMCQALSYRLFILSEPVEFPQLEGLNLLQSVWLGETDLLPQGALALTHTQAAAWWSEESGLDIPYLANLWLAAMNLRDSDEESRRAAFGRATMLLKTFGSFGQAYWFMSEIIQAES